LTWAKPVSCGEAALVCRDLGFDALGLDRLISITVRENLRSLRLM
jgi:hypothetical protein